MDISAKSRQLTSTASFESMLCAFEQLLDVTLTIHNFRGILCTPDGTPLLASRRSSHRRMDFCNARPMPRRACQRHCRGTVHTQASRRFDVFQHICPYGAMELVIPLWADDHYIGAIFAGIWRADLPRLKRSVTKSPLFQALPVVEPDRVEKLEKALKILAMCILAYLEETNPTDEQAPTRQTVISRFLKFRAHERVGLVDLAKVLYLSPSRAGHLVKELFGKPFRALLCEARIRHAVTLLRTTDYRVSEIARKIGIDDEYYFNRLFRRLMGKPPGKFRYSITN